ncbi:MAG: hypothetical protein L0Y72_30900 [Gemmataceae bacterium]|nr:hypothetical protein [Gemmataceae bacterium]MCI0743458.1 hypothetical protein [Gemmataceae bacterium]
MRITQRIGMLLLSIFLILYGLNILIKLNFEAMTYIVAGLAVAAGILILIEK